MVSLSLPVAIIYSAELAERKEEGELRVYRCVLTDLGRILFRTIKLTKEDKIADVQLQTE